LCMMARASARRGWCSDETAGRVEACVAAHGLPTGSELGADVLMRYMAHDKKRRGDGVNVVVPAEVGRCEVRRVSLDELAELVALGR
ncbi:MAG TPA: 3-dehydroquinate synthase, partial [Candidatus Olsenella avistercoris]|nr:3-dehydroquinate synthase [Candidatus Olsenella avistercoris]